MFRLKKTFLQAAFLIFTVCFTSSCYVLGDIEPRFSHANTGPYTFTLADLEQIRDQMDDDPLLGNEKDKLVAKAEAVLNLEQKYVTDKLDYVNEDIITLPGGDTHDYTSLARYTWPNPDPNAEFPYVVIDGRTNPDIELYDRPKLAQLSSSVYTLSLAYYYTEDERFAEKAAELIYKWFLDSETKMNPNLQYAQINYGESKRGDGQGIIDSNDFIPVLDAVSLIYDSPAWTADNHLELKRWFNDYLRWIYRNYNPVAYENNIGTWLDAQKTIYLLFTEQEKFLNSNSHVLPLSKRIELQFTDEGEQPLENRFGRPQHYTWFNLKGIITISLLRKHRDSEDRDWVTLNSPGGNSLRTALNRVLPYARGDIQWRQNLSESFDRCRYLEVYRPAAIAFQDSSYEDLVRKLMDDGCRNVNVLLTYPGL